MHMRILMFIVCLSHILGIQGSEQEEIYFYRSHRGERGFEQGNVKIEEIFDNSNKDNNIIVYRKTTTNPQVDIAEQCEIQRSDKLFNQLKDKYYQRIDLEKQKQCCMGLCSVTVVGLIAWVNMRIMALTCHR